MENCSVHPNSQAFGPCQTCKRPFCDSCLAFDLGRACGPCYEAIKQKRQITYGVIGVLAAAAVIALAISGKRSNDKVEAANAAKAAEEARIAAEPLDLRIAKRKLAVNPCDYGEALEVVDQYQAIGRHAEAVESVNQWQPSCGEPRKLLWRKFASQKQLQRYDDAVATANALIANKPTDVDFWWWRAEVLHHSNLVGAVADFRQSITNMGTDGRAKYAVGILTRVAEKSDQACEALFALNYFVNVQDGRLDRESDRSYQAILFSKACQDLVVGTSAMIGPAADKPGMYGEVAIGGETLVAQIDEKAGTTAITKAMAQTLGLAVKETELEGIVLGQAVRGRLATVPSLRLGGLELKNVDAMVVDALSNEATLVLGFNALWRLQPEAKGDKVMLSPWKL